MSWRRVFRSRWAAAAVASAGLAAAWWASGPLGLAGMALGLFGSGFNLLAMWGVIRLMGGLSRADAPSRIGAILTVVAFLVKLPLIFALMFLAHAIGGAAPGAFLIGLGMVYSALIGWALAAS